MPATRARSGQLLRVVHAERQTGGDVVGRVSGQLVELGLAQLRHRASAAEQGTQERPARGPNDQVGVPSVPIVRLF